MLTLVYIGHIYKALTCEHVCYVTRQLALTPQLSEATTELALSQPVPVPVSVSVSLSVPDPHARSVPAVVCVIHTHTVSRQGFRV